MNTNQLIKLFRDLRGFDENEKKAHADYAPVIKRFEVQGEIILTDNSHIACVIVHDRSVLYLLCGLYAPETLLAVRLRPGGGKCLFEQAKRGVARYATDFFGFVHRLGCIADDGLIDIEMAENCPLVATIRKPWIEVMIAPRTIDDTELAKIYGVYGGNTDGEAHDSDDGGFQRSESAGG